MSYIERTARKLMPILNEIKNRMVPEKTLANKDGKVPAKRGNKVETLDSVHEDAISEDDMNENNAEGNKKAQADMKNILGYLN